MDEKANETIEEVTKFIKLVNKHLKEKSCEHTIIEVAKEFGDKKE